MDTRHNPAALAAELLSLPPKPRPDHRSDRREARAAEQAVPPEVVNVSRVHRLQWEAARAEAETAEAATRQASAALLPPPAETGNSHHNTAGQPDRRSTRPRQGPRA
jgi:hypothetical protein